MTVRKRTVTVALAAAGVITGILVLAQRIKDLYDVTRHEYEDADEDDTEDA